jgi:hypothetical protein
MAEYAWVKIANQGETVFLSAGAVVRYGVSPTDRYVERTMTAEGQVSATNETFGDPAPTFDKWLFERGALLDPPPPGPTPAPPPQDVPTMPATLPNLPPLPAYPADGTDLQRSQWLTLAGLHTSAVGIEVQDRIATAQSTIATQNAEFYAAIPGVADILAGALDRFAEAISALEAAIRSAPAGGSAPADGITENDIGQFGRIVQAAKGVAPPSEG